MEDKFIEIFKNNLFQTEPNTGFKKMDNEGWNTFLRSGGLEVLKTSINEFIGVYTANLDHKCPDINEESKIQIDNLYKAFDDVRNEANNAKKLNNRFAEAVRLYVNAKAQPIDAYRACEAVLMMHEGIEIE